MTAIHIDGVRVLPPDAGQVYLQPSGRVTVKLTAAQTTRGAFGAWETVVPSGARGVPPHAHQREAIVFYVLSGRMTLLTEEGARYIPEGGCVYLPKGTLYTFRNDGSQPLKTLNFAFPGGFESFFAERAAPEAVGKAADLAVTAADLARIANRYGIQFSGQALPEGLFDPPRVIAAGSPEQYGVAGGRLTFLVPSDTTRDAYTLIESIMPPMGGMPVPHRHQHEDETFYVLEGEITFTLPDGRTEIGTAGTMVYSPRGTVHAFQNRSDRPARMLSLITPGANMERFFRTIGRPAPSDAELERAATPPSPEVIERIVTVSATHGIELVSL